MTLGVWFGRVALIVCTGVRPTFIPSLAVTLADKSCACRPTVPGGLSVQPVKLEQLMQLPNGCASGVVCACAFELGSRPFLSVTATHLPAVVRQTSRSI